MTHTCWVTEMDLRWPTGCILACTVCCLFAFWGYEHVSHNYQWSTDVESGQQSLVPPEQIDVYKPHTTTETPPEENTCEVSQRVYNVKRVCEGKGWVHSDWNLRNVHDGVLVDDKHELLYCMLPKCASISIRTLLAQLVTNNQQYEVEAGNEYFADTGFNLVDNITDEHREKVTRKYKKWIVVRHPFDRLRATYDDKLSGAGILNDGCLGKNIKFINRYLKSIDVHRNHSFDPWSEIITFHQFLHLVATEYHNGFRDQHWLPMSTTCWPCDINYDFVLRLETLPTDIIKFYDYLRSFEGNNPLISLPHLNEHYVKRNLLQEKLHDVSCIYRYVDTDIKKRLMELYQQDFELFGYQWTEREGAACQILTNNGSVTCC